MLALSVGGQVFCTLAAISLSSVGLFYTFCFFIFPYYLERFSGYRRLLRTESTLGESWHGDAVGGVEREEEHEEPGRAVRGVGKTTTRDVGTGGAAMTESLLEQPTGED